MTPATEKKRRLKATNLVRKGDNKADSKSGSRKYRKEACT